MDLILLAARLLLAAVFVTAGLAKLADLRGSRQAVVDFGLPSMLARPLGVVLPFAELAIAAALVVTVSAWWGAIAALGLLGLFIAGICANLALGRNPDCHCFGQLHSSPAGWSTVLRNGALATVAGLIIWQGRFDAGLSTVAWAGDLSSAELAGLLGAAVATLLLAALAWVFTNVVQQNGRLLARIERLETMLSVGGEPVPAGTDQDWPAGLPLGSPAPSFLLSGVFGETMTLDALRSAGKPVMLLFTDPNCGPCNALLPNVGTWQREHAGNLTIALISSGDVDANRAKSDDHGLSHVLLQDDREVAEAYQALATPTALLVAADGAIASAPAVGSDAIKHLFDEALQPPADATGSAARKTIPLARVPAARSQGNGHGHQMPTGTSAIGQPAPDVKLPDLKGRSVDLASFQGKSALVLFWNPSCGFCERMLGDLKAWEKKRPDSAPEIVVVSTGTVKANRTMGLRSTVVLDEHFAAGQAFGVTGTPSAVLVDADGRIASDPAVGAPGVLALAQRQEQRTKSA